MSETSRSSRKSAAAAPPAVNEAEAAALEAAVFETHAHVHRHADGTIHNHYHRHAGGLLPHDHGEGCAHEHGGAGRGRGLEDADPPVHSHGHEARGRVALRAEGVSYAYPQGGADVFARLDLEARAGEVLAILGNNGAGKSTLLNLLAGIVKPREGAVFASGKDIARMGRREIARHVAYVAQQQRIPHLSVYDQVLLGRKPHISWAVSDYDRTVTAETIDRLGLASFSARYVDELSGGERQKVHIARALAQEPEVLLLDEPTSALDPKNQIEVLETVREATRSELLATVLVIHDINLALRFCDRFLLVRDGCVVARGGRDAVDAAALTTTYDIPFHVGFAEGIPVALPLGRL